MKKLAFKYLVVTTAATLSLSALNAFAEDNLEESVPPPKPEAVDYKSRVTAQEVRKIQLERKDDVQMMRASTSDAVAAQRKAIEEKIRALRESGSSTPKEIEALRKQMMGEVKDLRVNLREDIAERRDVAHEDIENALEKRRIMIASSTDRIKENARQKAFERAGAYVKKMIDRMSAAIDRFEKMTERVQSRIDKVKKAGGATIESQTALDSAKAKISTAKNGLATLGNNFASTTLMSNPADGIKSFQDAALKIRDEIRGIQDSIQESIDHLKGQKGSTTNVAKVIKDSGEDNEDSSATTTSNN